MPKNQQQIFHELERSLRLLIAKYSALKDENQTLKKELQQKEEALMIAHKNILELRSTKESLRVARGLSFNEKDRAEAQRKLSQLVRDIDSCLILINE